LNGININIITPLIILDRLNRHGQEGAQCQGAAESANHCRQLGREEGRVSENPNISNPHFYPTNPLQIQIDVDAVAGGSQAGYDEANALVLPSEKRATKIKVDKVQHVKILTKKQRKHLQAIVDKKKKKEGVGFSH